MATAVVESAVRPTTFNVTNRSNMVLRGLVFRHAADCLNTTGASIGSSSNVLIDSVQAVWNNWGGMGSILDQLRHRAELRGQLQRRRGIHANRDQNLLFSFNESDYNNWRGAQGALYDWAWAAPR